VICAPCCAGLATLQALAVKEAATLRSELEDARQALERIQSHYAQAEAEKAKEVARMKVGHECSQKCRASLVPWPHVFERTCT